MQKIFFIADKVGVPVGYDEETLVPIGCLVDHPR